MYIKPELFTFLRELKQNNNRGWFEANRGRYERDVKTPLLAFISAFGDRLPAISPYYQAIPRVTGGSMFRIYRDLRFSPDKTPYKTAAALHFRHESAQNVHAPGFYLHLEPGEVFMSCGVWKPSRGYLTRIRERIAENPVEWQALVNDPDFAALYTVVGDSLQRPPQGFDPAHPLIGDIQRKDFLVSQELDEGTACRDDFLDYYYDLCSRAAPFMRFLTEAIGLPW